MNETIIFVIVVFWLLPSFVIAEVVGNKKTLGFGVTLLICLLTSPIIGLIAAYLSKDLDQAEAEKELMEKAAGKSIPEQLEKLHQPKGKGILTEQEYSTQKSKLLNQE